MRKRGFYINPDGHLSVMIPNYDRGPTGSHPEFTDEEFYDFFVARVLETQGLIGTTTYEMPETDMPSDRTFREAWECPGGVIKVNMPKARGIHMDRIRVVRNAELAAKDITFMRAVEAGDASAQSTIATQKQTLRDIPQTFDLTTDNAEQLKAKWPTELPPQG